MLCDTVHIFYQMYPIVSSTGMEVCRKYWETIHVSLLSRSHCLHTPEPGHDEKGFLTSGRVRVGFDQKSRVSGSGSGIVHFMVLRLILWSFCVIPFYARGQSKQMNVMLFR